MAWPNIRKPQCPDGYQCSDCTKSSKGDYVMYVPGDLYVVGIMPIHSSGSTPLECGGIKRGGLDVAEAMRFAIKEAKDYGCCQLALF